jgi:hypothetical protein
LRRVVSLQQTDVSEVCSASVICTIALKMEAVRTSVTSVCSKETTRCNIPGGFNLHTRRRENLKSHKNWKVLFNYWATCINAVKISMGNCGGYDYTEQI